MSTIEDEYTTFVMLCSYVIILTLQYSQTIFFKFKICNATKCLPISFKIITEIII